MTTQDMTAIQSEFLRDNLDSFLQFTMNRGEVEADARRGSLKPFWRDRDQEARVHRACIEYLCTFALTNREGAQNASNFGF